VTNTETAAGADPAPDIVDAGALSRALPLAGDVVALSLLAGLFWYLERHDGGRTRSPLVFVAVVALLAAPVAVAEVRQLTPVVRGAVAAYGLGWLAALGFALDRSAWVMPSLILGLVPVVALAARRVWRRAWGPQAFLALLLVSFGVYTVRSWLQWWGSTMLDFQPLWLALSWRNQSGVLMGAFLLVGLGLALRARGIVRAAGLLVVAVSGAGAWLSSSRGALVFLAGAVLVVLAVEARSRRTADTAPVHRFVRRIGLPLLAGLVGAVAVTGLLLALLPSGVASPLGSRSTAVDDASTNALLRLSHMRAAIGMFGEQPLTGMGPGSYRLMAQDHTPATANLTLSAHNEYAEVLGEGGVAGGLPFLVLHAGLAVLVLRRVRDGVPRPDGEPDLDVRGAVELGVLGAATLVAAHASFDFDWLYPVLPGFVALGGAVLTAQPHGTRGRPAAAVTDRVAGPLAGLACLPVLLLLALGFVAEQRAFDGGENLTQEEFLSVGVPWDTSTKASIAAELLQRGEVELAGQIVDEALTWSPGVEALRSLHARVAFAAGSLTAQELVDTLVPGRSRFLSHVAIADQLVDAGELELADEVLSTLLPQLEEHVAWGVTQTWLDAGLRHIALGADLHGCDRARQRAARVRDSQILEGQPSEVFDAIDAAERAGCGG
jgi:O-antigen ligase